MASVKKKSDAKRKSATKKTSITTKTRAKLKTPASKKKLKTTQVKSDITKLNVKSVSSNPKLIKIEQKPVLAPVSAKQPLPSVPNVTRVPAQQISKKLSFKVSELVVYPAHGVGKIVQIEEQEIAGAKLELYVIDFEKEKLRLKVPTSRAEQKGMRRLSDKVQIEAALKVLRGRARIRRTMWSRRAQEYDTKINSGIIVSVAEVVRDLFRSERQSEQSYSERQLFEQALERMAREVAAVKRIDTEQASKELEDYLIAHAKRTASDKTLQQLTPEEEAA